MADVMTDPKVVEELLRQRGLLATGGRIRPLGDMTNASSSGAPAAATGSATAAALSGAPATVDPATALSAFGDPNNPTADTAAKLDGMSDDELAINWPLIAGAAAGSALALLVKNLMTKRGIPAPDVVPGAVSDPLAPKAGIPTMEGVVEPTPAITGDYIQNGEYTVVPQEQLAGQKALPAPGPASFNDPAGIATTRALQRPQGKVEDLGTPPKYLTAQELRKRKAAGVAAGGTGVKDTGPAIPLTDKYMDLTPPERAQAMKIADELIARRAAGRDRMYAQRKKGVGQKMLPTLPIDKERAYNDVVRMIREGRKNPQALRKALTR